MGNRLFGVDIAGIIHKNISPGILDAVISREVEGARSDGSLTSGKTKTAEDTTGLGVRGFWEDFNSQGSAPPGITLELNDRKALIIGDSIPAGWIPRRNYGITIDGQTLYVVKPLSVDPANAVYTFLCRDRRGPDGE